MRPAEHELTPPLMRVTSATRLVDAPRPHASAASRRSPGRSNALLSMGRRAGDAVDPLREWTADRTEPPVVTWPLIGLCVPEPPPPVAKRSTPVRVPFADR